MSNSSLAVPRCPSSSSSSSSPSSSSSLQVVLHQLTVLTSSGSGPQRVVSSARFADDCIYLVLSRTGSTPSADFIPAPAALVVALQATFFGSSLPSRLLREHQLFIQATRPVRTRRQFGNPRIDVAVQSFPVPSRRRLIRHLHASFSSFSSHFDAAARRRVLRSSSRFCICDGFHRIEI